MTDHQHTATPAAPDHDKTDPAALYFLAEHYCSEQQYPLAVDIIDSKFDGCTELPWLLLALKAEALHALGQQDQAVAAARQALATVSADPGHDSLVTRFAALDIAV